ncbi:MAG: nucleotidyltransferase domain-containing protein, partial [Clostridia bacterium]|nr:nucleotidyltransferase domain-containing protein [Clostridia bacterium]
LLSIEKIKEVCESIFKEYNIECAYLVGSYAKGEENETSNVDIFVLVREDNYNLDEMVEILRENLKKKINLLDILNLKNNIDLVQDVLRDGIKIYVHGEK